MSEPTPAKRFKPEPIETSTRSSKRLAPEPVETSTRSSRKFAPEPIETTKSSRRFAPEPVETSTRSTRKFAPQPIEITVSSSREQQPTDGSGKVRRRFKPEPIETTKRSRRKDSINEDDPSALEGEQSGSSSARPRRKFAPQLLETAQRSRRAGDSEPVLRPHDATDALPANPKSIRPGLQPIQDGSMLSSRNIPMVNDLRRSESPGMQRSNSRGSNRSHSFRVPDLDPIESSQSEESNPASPTTSLSSADRAYPYKHATRMRESVDERVKGYLLELAAKAAEKQLRETAMAAFPNNEFHEPVDHFIDAEEESSEPSNPDSPFSQILLPHERPSRFSRDDQSFTTIDWDLKSMQQHGEKLQLQKEMEKKAEAEKMKSAAFGPWGDPSAALFAGQQAKLQKDAELERMRNDARPPMLGGDIEFPRCESPAPERFDVTQATSAQKKSMCYLTEQIKSQGVNGLWHAQPAEVKAPRASLWRSPQKKPSNEGGLWGGYCKKTGTTPPKGHSGLLTPNEETGNPFESPPPTPAQPTRPVCTPQISSSHDFRTIDEKLATEAAIEEEFNDAFVTQVYNYLSLGYPSIARNFDEELSKISKAPISELRKDDHLAESRGYIRLGEDDSVSNGVTEESCNRWKALRTYIHEWARQQPHLKNEGQSPGPGMAVRRGSWAW